MSKPPPRPASRGHLLKILGVGFGLAVIIGNTIGAGIMRAPGNVAAELPNSWLFMTAWLVGGAYALLGAISLAELGATLPRSGGQYVFVRYALGDYAGFVAGWSDWISTCGAAATMAVVISGFTGALVPYLSSEVTILAIVITLVFVTMQWRGMVWGSNVQNTTSLLKTVAFIVLIVAAFWIGRTSSAFTQTTVTAVHASLFVAFTLALQGVIYTYDGWTGVIYFSEEVKNPGRDIPRSMIGGVLAVIAIYLLLNMAVLYVSPIAEIAGKDFAVGVAAQSIFGRYGDTVFRLLTIVSLLSALNACLLMGTRVLFAMSRDRLFVKNVAEVSTGGTPTTALLVSTAVSVLFIVFGQTFEKLITILAFFFVGTYTLSFTSVFVLRRREPDRPRPYRAWGYPWTTGISLAGSILFLAAAVWSDTRNSLYALALLGVSYPVFLITKKLVK
jgi:APA family basic amino acid/polyamine antiporter